MACDRDLRRSRNGGGDQSGHRVGGARGGVLAQVLVQALVGRLQGRHRLRMPEPAQHGVRQVLRRAGVLHQFRRDVFAGQPDRMG